ncbi:MAG TPA: hypothetical protein VFZ65_04690 [Planctomycetota bacterium]|nr:hypothetical protein [Planctomycetota bacterium]
MKFDKRRDPAACAAKDASRYAVTGVAVVTQGDHTFLAATDGKCLTLVRAHSEEGDDVGGIYPVAAFAAARKAAKRKDDATLALNGAASIEADGVRTEFAKVDGTFPDVWSIVPKAPTVGVLRIDAELLARIQKAMGASAVEIRVHAMAANGCEVDPSLPLTIAPAATKGTVDDDGSRGFLMPIRGD